MAGRIRREDVQAVRERARIEDIVGQHVALKSAGVGSMKGLCPFHDERSPSFHVRPQVGLYHCFGCGEGGDVIDFVQKIDGLPFTEAVEYLAGRVGLQVRYEEGGAPRPGQEPGRRQRLLEAHRVAAEFYAEQLTTPPAAAARAFLSERGFDRAAAEQFGVGYAPQGWDSLLRHLRGRGFTEAELTSTGLMSQGQGNRGQYDRFRGRLVWPIREVTGDTVGFGARRLYEEDQGPKYLNTPETALYKKSQVLYGIDLAKREISRAKQVVVVEGYTDVMAMHLSGVGTAVATCGTAFGTDHARIVRRLMGDSGSSGGVQLASGASVGGEVIFTFDGDAAGQKAAMRAFGEDQSFSAQTFVAVEPGGMDPCELRQAQGPDAVSALVKSRTPLFEFVIRTTLDTFNLATAEGRVGALRAAAPAVAGIRDTALRPEYTRMLAGWLGMDERSVQQAVTAAVRSGAGRPPRGAAATGAENGRGGQGGPERRGGPDGRTDPRDGGRTAGDEPRPVPLVRMPLPDPRDPVASTERRVLEAALQLPEMLPAEFDELGADGFTAPAYRAVHEAIRAAGGLTGARAALAGRSGEAATAAWVEAVREEAAAPVAGLVRELAVTPLPEDRADALPGYVRGLVLALVEMRITRQIAELNGRLQRTDLVAEPDEYRRLNIELMAEQARRRALRENA